MFILKNYKPIGVALYLILLLWVSPVLLYSQEPETAGKLSKLIEAEEKKAPRFRAGLKAGMFLPQMAAAQSLGSGFGFMGQFELRNRWLPYLDYLGVEAGFISLSSNRPEFNANFLMIPVLAYTSKTFKINQKVRAFAKAGTGLSLLSFEKEYNLETYPYLTAANKSQSASSADFTVIAGGGATYALPGSSFLFFAELSYIMQFETQSGAYLTLLAGSSWMF